MSGDAPLRLYVGALLADASVDPFAQQIRVTHVARVLEHHADHRLAERHRSSTTAMQIQRIVAGDIKARRLGHEPGREVRLYTPCRPLRSNHFGVGNGTVEIAVAVAVEAVQPWHVLSRQHHAERRALHLRQVSHQPEQ